MRARAGTSRGVGLLGKARARRRPIHVERARGPVSAHRSIRTVGRAAVLGVVVLLARAAPATSAPDAPVATPPTKQELHFRVTVGPASQPETCDVVADFYLPADASRSHRVPVILATNGFGGSKNENSGAAAWLGDTDHDYAFLSYSGLGFGGSGCEINLDDPDFDGKAASQLIDWLGGVTPTNAYGAFDKSSSSWSSAIAPPDVIALDGDPSAHDPRLGMIGGSYGGEIQLATAAIDDRVDTVVPMITWNDLRYSLAPSNTIAGDGAPSEPLAGGRSGVAKRLWALGFFASGATSPLVNDQSPLLIPGLLDQLRQGTLPCPGFAAWICTELASAALSGHVTSDGDARLLHVSAASYLDRVRIPTLLVQGELDSLFDLQESVATYQSLRANGVPVQLMWQRRGHSGGGPDGEFTTKSPELADASYQGQVFADWFDYWLKPDHGDAPAPALDFSFFRQWVFDATGDAKAAYAHAPAYPIGDPYRLYLSGTDHLVATPGEVAAGGAPMLVAPAVPTPGLGAATSFSDYGPFGNVAGTGPLLPPPSDVALLSASWTSDVLPGSIDVVGVPTADVALQAPVIAILQEPAQPDTNLVLFAKVYDVAPDGSLTLVNRLVSPMRVDDVTRPVHVQLPGIVHRFDAGHRIRFALATSDFAFGANPSLLAAQPVIVPTSAAAPGVVSLPVVGEAPAPLAPSTPDVLDAPGAAPSSTLPATGPAFDVVPFCTLLVCAGLALRRIRRHS
ncbi:MAG: CocE/NonD family hydrolase [Acidimicrobiales bacterium]